jgi:hypothetical protein
MLPPGVLVLLVLAQVQGYSAPQAFDKRPQAPNAWGYFPTWLVIPGTNFTSDFPKLGYLGIKRIFDEANIGYSKKTIVQASSVKSHLKTLGINKSSHTPISLDIESFYPSVTFQLVQKVVTFYAQKLPMKDKLVVCQCLNAIHFGMANTLLQFRGQYFEYDGDKNVLDKGLKIGGYKSAWLTKLVIAYVLEKTKNHFKGTTYYGIYCDDGLVIFLGILCNMRTSKKRRKKQSRVIPAGDSHVNQ